MVDPGQGGQEEDRPKEVVLENRQLLRPAVEELRGEQLAFRQSSPVAAVEKLQPMKLPSMTPAAPKPVPVQKPVMVPEKGRMVHDDWRPPYQTAQPLPIEPEEEEVSLPAKPVLEKREEPEPMPGISETNSVETLEKPAEEPVENISLTEEPEESPASRLISANA